MKKKSARKSVEQFRMEADEIRNFVRDMLELRPQLSAQYQNWIYEQAVIRLYRAFENLILSCLIAAINNDTRQLSDVTDVHFPKHLNDKVCRYIIVGDGHFNFRGGSDLVGKLKKFLPKDHYLVEEIAEQTCKQALERLSALRNYAAHDSETSKKRALKAVDQKKINQAGAWLKSQGRLEEIMDKLDKLANRIDDRAPY